MDTNNSIFENKTKVYFGRGCVKEYLRCLKEDYGDTVMLACGGGSVRENGVYDEVMSALEEAGKKVVEFSGIMPDPTYAKVLEGAALARESHAGLILGVGGGTVMDCCKAVSVAARYDGDMWADFWARPGVMDFEPLPVGAIVTGTGTGSECSGSAVIINEELKVKTERDYPKCSPRFALLDPAYTCSIPKYEIASGSFEILSSIMEVYFNEPDEDNVSDNISEALMRNVIRNLRKAIENPQNYTVRSDLMRDTAAESRVINLGEREDYECCQMEYPPDVYTNCSRGAALAVLRPVYYKHIYKDRPGKFKRFAVNVWGVNAEGKSNEEIALEGIEALKNFILEIGLPMTICEADVDEDTDLKKIVDSCNAAPESYRRVSNEVILEILSRCW